MTLPENSRTSSTATRPTLTTSTATWGTGSRRSQGAGRRRPANNGIYPYYCLAAVGGVVGGGMLAGIITVAAAPIAGGVAAYGLYRLYKKLASR